MLFTNSVSPIVKLLVQKEVKTRSDAFAVILRSIITRKNHCIEGRLQVILICSFLVFS